MDFKKDYYRILNVPRNADAVTIKKAYRQLAKKYHPDLTPGDVACEEKIKLINEAWEVLGNNDQRFAYDVFFNQQAAEAVPKPKTKRKAKSKPQPTPEPKKRETKRKQWVTKEQKVYFTGIIRIKYHGEQDEARTIDVLKEVFYQLHLMEAEATVLQKNIFPGEIPTHFQTAYRKPHLKVPQLRQVRCIVGDRHYLLDLEDLIIVSPHLEYVTKDDGDSFGTIVATFYAHVIYYHQEEVETTSNEFYGETGKREYRNDSGARYERRQYYHATGDTYWGNWMRTSPFVRPPRVSTPGGCLPSTGGCLGNVFSLIFILLILPRLLVFWPLLLILGIGWLLSLRFFRPIFAAFGILLLIGFFISLFHTFNHPYHPRAVIPHEKPAESVKRVRKNGLDSLITRYREWQDYDGRSYQGVYSLSLSAWRNAHRFKENFPARGDAEQTYNHALYGMAQLDDSKLSNLYHLLEAKRDSAKLNREQFPQMVASLIQDIPYVLVLPKSCDASLYDDHGVAAYLSKPDAHCDPDQRFGINSPVEFLATLNGDCDTRTLLAYTILKHYGYSVAVLSSKVYGHSLLGIDLPYDGKTFPGYNGRQYVLWELTTFARPGLIADEVSDLDNWQISITSDL